MADSVRHEIYRGTADLRRLENLRCSELRWWIREMTADEAAIRDAAPRFTRAAATAVLLVKADRLARLRALAEEELALRERLEQVQSAQLDASIEILFGRELPP